MLYYSFKNFEEFKELFGIVEHGNGVKSRKNKILLAMYKDKTCLKNFIKYLSFTSDKSEYYHFNEKEDGCTGRDKKHMPKYTYCVHRYRLNILKTQTEVKFFDLLSYDSLPPFYRRMEHLLGYNDLRKPGAGYDLNLMDNIYPSDKFCTDSLRGICEDGTLNAIRYKSIEKGVVFKMKAGRMVEHFLSCNVITDILPEQIKRWYAEEFVAQWIEYARQRVGEDKYTLHIDDNFEDIYSRDCCLGYDDDDNSFGSCMVDDEQWTFYRDAVDAQAAYLTDVDDKIVARCIIFTDVVDSDGKKWRLAERQYSAYCKPDLQRQLIAALINAKAIDGFKVVGASCGDAKKFVDVNGNSLHDKNFHIRCKLEDGDTISYQDSFKWFDYEEQEAYNYPVEGYTDLATTDGSVEIAGREWSDFNQEYIPSSEAYYISTREDYFYANQVMRAEVWDRYDKSFHVEYCYCEDCIEIGGKYYFAGVDADDPEQYGLCKCDRCGDYYVGEDGYYSDLLNEGFCSESCMEEAENEYKEENWFYVEYDDEYVEDEDEILEAYIWNGYYHKYELQTIKESTFNLKHRLKKATVIDGVCYVDDSIGYDGYPVHYAAAETAA